jgi:RHS repeat-associated protein
VNVTAAQVGAGNDTDDFGVTLTAAAPSYGWVGAKQRTTNTLTGLVQMGIRLYNPTTGRFPSIDPVYGGNDNPYTYPADPINRFDVDGQYSKREPSGQCSKTCQKKLARYAHQVVAAEREGDLHKVARLLFTLSYLLGQAPSALCPQCAVASTSLGVLAFAFFLVTNDYSNAVKTAIATGIGVIGGKVLDRYVGNAMKQITNPNTSVGKLIAGYLGDSFIATLTYGVEETGFPG